MGHISNRNSHDLAVLRTERNRTNDIRELSPLLAANEFGRRDMGDPMPLKITIDRQSHEVRVAPGTVLLDLRRENLTAPREGEIMASAARARAGARPKSATARDARTENVENVKEQT